MSNKDTDILLIRKYLNGELDAHAMHQLERRAQDDPFLMDALEGYEKVGKEQQYQLAEISERLHQRINRKERRLIPWKTLSIAASGLIFTTIGGLLLFNQTPVTKPRIVQHDMVAPDVVNAAKPDTISTVGKSVPVLKHMPLLTKQSIHIRKNRPIVTSAAVPTATVNEMASIDVNKAAKADKDTGIPLNQVIVMGYASQRKKDVTGPVATISPGYMGKPSTDSPATALQGRIAGVNIANGDNFKRSIRGLSKNRINGRVIAKDDGQPLVGVTVRISGTNKSSVTDVNGKFSINADSGKTNKLIIAYIGYNSTEVMARTSDSLRSITLAPASNSLSEVVVTGYSSNRNDTNDDPLVIDAHPVNGWSSLKKYFDENAVSPDGKKGIVKLSFMVDRNGNVTGIKVLKSVSVETDAKAIDLINNGPGWVGSTSKRTENVTVRVKFTK